MNTVEVQRSEVMNILSQLTCNDTAYIIARMAEKMEMEEKCARLKAIHHELVRETLITPEELEIARVGLDALFDGCHMRAVVKGVNRWDDPQDYISNGVHIDLWYHQDMVSALSDIDAEVREKFLLSCKV